MKKKPPPQPLQQFRSTCSLQKENKLKTVENLRYKRKEERPPPNLLLSLLAYCMSSSYFQPLHIPSDPVFKFKQTSIFSLPFQKCYTNFLNSTIQPHESSPYDPPEISSNLLGQTHHTQAFRPVPTLNSKTFIILFPLEEMTFPMHLFYLYFLFLGSILGLSYKAYSNSPTLVIYSSYLYFCSKYQLFTIVSCHLLLYGTYNYST